MLFKKFTPVLLSSTLVLSANAFAYEEIIEDGYAQFRIGGGVTWLHGEGSEIGITSTSSNGMEFTEVDTLTESTSDHVTALGTIGVGYVIPFDPDSDEDFIWFPGMIISLDATYQFETELTGDVYGYRDPNYDDFTYVYGIQNTNLLANLTLGIAEYERWTLFAIGGLGIAWTWVEYTETPKVGVNGFITELDSHANTTFAWQAGGGVGFEIMPELDVTLTYLYTDLDKVQTSSNLKTEDNLHGTNQYVSTTPEFE
ncbi:MAG: hypothetical protein ABSF18_04920 [Gammaproteobacteria bacterium]